MKLVLLLICSMSLVSLLRAELAVLMLCSNKTILSLRLGGQATHAVARANVFCDPLETITEALI